MIEPACLDLRREGAIAHLRLVRPDRANAMTRDFWHALPKALDSLIDDASIRVLVLSGEGKHFCAGMDLDAFAGMEMGRDAEEGARWRNNFRKNLLRAQAVFTRLEELRVPVIA